MGKAFFQQPVMDVIVVTTEQMLATDEASHDSKSDIHDGKTE